MRTQENFETSQLQAPGSAVDSAKHSPVLGAIARMYDRFAILTAILRSPFLLVVRVYWGWQFISAGWGKLEDLSHAAQFFAGLAVPHPHASALLVGVLEFGSGVLLVAGLFARVAGLALSGVMIGAYVVASREALLSIFSDPNQFYGADPYPFLFAAALVLIFGAGKFSFDHLLAHLAVKQDPSLGKPHIPIEERVNLWPKR